MINRCFIFLLILFPTLLFGQTSDKDAYTLGVKGIQKVDAGEYELGIKLLKKARNLNPKEYDYTLEIGKAYLKSGNPKKAERFLFDLQYHVNVKPDLYLLLAECSAKLNELRSTPDPERKREMKALQYGIDKLSGAGIIYLELGQLKLELEQPTNALAIWEKGIQNAPDFPENYFWASKMMKAGGNDLWTWIYAEMFFNMTEDEELKRTASLLVSESSIAVLEDRWNSDYGQLEQQLRILLTENCNSNKESGLDLQLSQRQCLLENFTDRSSSIAPLFERMRELEEQGWLEAYVADIHQTVDKESFLKWLANNARVYDSYAKWSYWNRLSLAEPIIRSK
ncbi:MAG: hypothetical protein QF371_08300 [Flavobacteriales bacterium]|jgi:hypothetical protein|nr:hypothetical protein [Flavobacteriales bacterium]